jgi:hypothetical protein
MALRPSSATCVARGQGLVRNCDPQVNPLGLAQHAEGGTRRNMRAATEYEDSPPPTKAEQTTAMGARFQSETPRNRGKYEASGRGPVGSAIATLDQFLGIVPPTASSGRTDSVTVGEGSQARHDCLSPSNVSRSVGPDGSCRGWRFYNRGNRHMDNCSQRALASDHRKYHPRAMPSRYIGKTSAPYPRRDASGPSATSRVVARRIPKDARQHNVDRVPLLCPARRSGLLSIGAVDGIRVYAARINTTAAP